MADAHQATSAMQQRDREQPKVSCARCRDQKLKCNRELPGCVRCRKQNVQCIYPPPPDRRRIAQRVNEAKALERLTNGTAKGDSPRRISTDAAPGKSVRTKSSRQESLPGASPGRSDGSIGSTSTATSAHPSANDPLETSDLPSTEVGLLLLEVYFKRVYNATLLFHKAMLFDSYIRQGIPDYLLQAIFAHAAVFLQNVETTHRDHVHTFAMHKIFERSWSWARSASKEVLSSADDPTLSRIQALQVLQLYYFSRGDSKRSRIHLSLAYQLGQILGYSELRGDADSANYSQHLAFEEEMQRRCFWAMWCSISLGQPLAMIEGIRDAPVGLPLPAKLDLDGTQSRELVLGEKMKFDWETKSRSALLDSMQDGGQPSSFMAEIIKCLGVWVNVREFISEIPTLLPLRRASWFEMLVARADAIHCSSDLNLANICSQAELYNESPELLASVYSAHLLNLVFLYSAMVCSQLTDRGDTIATNKIAQRYSTKVLEHASTFAKLMQILLEQKFDLTKLWPLTGYGAFVVSKVFTIYHHEMQRGDLGSSAPRVPGPGSVEMRAALAVLDISSVFWEPCRDFTTKFEQLRTTHSFSDLHTIISFSYPWGGAYPERLQQPAEAIPTPSNDFDTTLPLFEDLAVHVAMPMSMDADNSVSAMDQQAFMYSGPATGFQYPDVFDTAHLGMDLDTFMAGNNINFDDNFWNNLGMDGITS